MRKKESHKGKKARTIIWMAGCLLFLLSAMQSPLFAEQAQEKQIDSTKLVSLYVMDEEVESSNRQTISIHAAQESLLTVLKQVANEVHVGLSYQEDIILDKNITVHIEDMPVFQALEVILKGTGLKAVLPFSRDVLVIKRKLKATKVAQIGSITGTVTNEEGEPIPSANVLLVEIGRGAATNLQGEYTIENVEAGTYTLRVSFVGYETYEDQVTIEAGQQLVRNVTLGAETEALSELVVVGYGTQQKAKVTGAISSISAEELQNIPVVGFGTALKGKVAGVTVSTPSAAPGAPPQIKIRGVGSISAGNDPLIVIDGVPLSSGKPPLPDLNTQRASFESFATNPLSAINTNDIASIDVLKGASAAAIYGSRASNGVILITTKTGSAGEMQVHYSGYVGHSTVVHRPDLMEAKEVIEYTRESRNNLLKVIWPNLSFDRNSNKGRINPVTGDSLPGYLLLPPKYVHWDGQNTDWLSLVLRDGWAQSHYLSLGGGSQKVRYSVSGGYLNRQGNVAGTGYKRYTLALNLTADISEILRTGVRLNGAFAKYDKEPVSAPYFGRPPGIIYSAMVHSPVIKPYHDDGPTPYNQLHGQSYMGHGMTSASNPLAIMDAVDSNVLNNRVFGNIFGQLDVTDYLAFRTKVGFDVNDFRRSLYRSNELFYRTAQKPNPFAQASSAEVYNWFWANTLNYSNTFGEHDINALVGYTAQKQHSESTNIFAEQFPDDRVKTISGGIATSANQVKEEWSIASAFVRVQYSYDDAYLLTASIRRDVSSRFGEDSKVGIFPSASVGYRLTESLLSDQDLFSELKLRASYGVTGNFSIPNYGSIGLLGEANYVLSGSEVNGLAQTTFGEDDLSWETTYTLDIGLDFALLNDRIYGSFDFYNSHTKDLLLFVTVPAVTGYNTILTNIGEVRNRGFEFAITSRNIVGDFLWTTKLNFATNNNAVLALGPTGQPILSRGAAGIRHITKIGAPAGSYYGFVVQGIYNSKQELKNAPPDKLVGRYGAQLGDFRFKDVNSDGVITVEDKTIIGNYQPEYTWGITNNFRYKNFNLSVFVQSVQGREILNLTFRHLKNGQANFNSYEVLVHRWQSPQKPGNGKIPRASRVSVFTGNNNRPSNYQVEDASYISIERVTLGYSLPQSLIGAYVQNMRVYASVNNLYMFTDYKGWNPETSLQANNQLTPGEAYGTYPMSRTIQIGIDINF